MHGDFRSSDGVRLAYDLDDFTTPWTREETMLLIHPAMSSSRRLYSFVPHLCRDFRVVRQDMRGHGASEIPPANSPVTIERLGKDAIELLDHVGASEPIHLVGVSAGGFVSQYVAATFPDRIKSLSLIATVPDPRSIDTSSWIPRIKEIGLKQFFSETIGMRFDIPRVDPKLVAWFLDEIGKNDDDFICRYIAMALKLDLTALLSQIVCPTLIVAAGNQTILSNSSAETMRAKIRDSEVIIYPGFNHNISDSAGDRCALDVRGFIQRRFGLPSLLGFESRPAHA